MPNIYWIWGSTNRFNYPNGWLTWQSFDLAPSPSILVPSISYLGFMATCRSSTSTFPKSPIVLSEKQLVDYPLKMHGLFLFSGNPFLPLQTQQTIIIFGNKTYFWWKPVGLNQHQGSLCRSAFHVSNWLAKTFSATCGLPLGNVSQTKRWLHTHSLPRLLGLGMLVWRPAWACWSWLSSPWPLAPDWRSWISFLMASSLARLWLEVGQATLRHLKTQMGPAASNFIQKPWSTLEGCNMFGSYWWNLGLSSHIWVSQRTYGIRGCHASAINQM